MSELAREEILAVLEAWKKDFSRMQIWYESDEEIYQAIRRLSENMAISKKFWHKWSGRIQDDYNLGSMHIIYLIESMLRELGHEMEEKEEKCRS